MRTTQQDIQLRTAWLSISRQPTQLPTAIQPPGPRYDISGTVRQPGVAPTVVNRAQYRDWMAPAVLSCLCCFWPTGICAIIAASNANQAAEAGDVIEAERQSRNKSTMAGIMWSSFEFPDVA
uniref:Proline-rich transmembrane protein 1 n=1 Tax=Magallana gigas TaxID=29159 RepID=K1QET5_MAGGI